MTRKYIVDQRMGNSKNSWEYRNTYDTSQEAIDHVIEHMSESYPYRIRQVVSTIIFEENKEVKTRFQHKFKIIKGKRK